MSTLTDSIKELYEDISAEEEKSATDSLLSDILWPAKSTINDLLKRHGLVTRAKRKRSVTPYTQPFILCGQSNDSWSIDYKGQFLLGNKELCYPLTVTISAVIC